MDDLKEKQKNCLLMMPHFRGYDTTLKAELEKRFRVFLYDNERPLGSIPVSQEQIDAAPLLRSLFMRISRRLDRKRAIIGFSLRKVRKQHYDFILIFNGHMLPNSFYRKLLRKNPHADRVVYLWDDFAIKKPKHLKFFPKVCSFNLDDCKQYGFTYLPVYTQTAYCGHAEDRYDIAFIGQAHDNRIGIVQNLYQKYKDRYKFYIYLCDENIPQDNGWFHRKPMPYGEYMKILKESECVLDIPYATQTGPTTRFFDALQTDTKVITTFAKITEYPIFSENISILDPGNPFLDEIFLASPYMPNDLKATTVSDWIDAITEVREK